MSKVCVLDRLAHRNHTLVQVDSIACKQDTCFNSCSYMFADVHSIICFLVVVMYTVTFSFAALSILIFGISFSSLM